jgi:NitT/TauT family transport system substrate-binding protein
VIFYAVKRFAFQNRGIKLPDRLETELKFIIADPEAARATLIWLGAASEGRHVEENIRLDDGRRSLTAQSIVLRLRGVEHEGQVRAILTVKTPGDTGDAFKSRREIELEVSDGPAAIAALSSGEVDYASIGGAQAVFRSKARGLDLSIIGCISRTTNYILLGDKQTRTVEDLKGKSIGITGAGTYSEFAVKTFLKKNNIDPTKDVTLRAIGGTVLRAAAIQKGLIAAAPFSTEDAVRLMRSGYSVISNMNESLGIPQNILVTRDEVLEKFPETTKRMLKAYIMGIQLAKFNKKEAIKAGYDSGLHGDPDIVSSAWDLYAPGLTADLSIAVPGIQQMLDEDIRSGIIDSKFTIDRVVNDRILRIAQQELKAKGRLKQ